MPTRDPRTKTGPNTNFTLIYHGWPKVTLSWVGPNRPAYPNSRFWTLEFRQEFFRHNSSLVEM